MLSDKVQGEIEDILEKAKTGVIVQLKTWLMKPISVGGTQIPMWLPVAFGVALLINKHRR